VTRYSFEACFFDL